MFTALQSHFAKHALTWVIATLLGLAASFTAVYDNFWIIEREDMAKLGWWQIVAVTVKCIAPFATTVVAYLIKSPVGAVAEEKQKPNDPAPAA
jgi:hypothetical protein